MKSCSSGLNTHIQGHTTLTTVLVLKRTDGTVICVTEHDENLLFNSAARAALLANNFIRQGGVDVTALSYAGFSRFNLNDKDNLETSNIQLDGMIDGSIFTRDDIKAERFDKCDYQVFMVNWKDLTQGEIRGATGSTGTWTIKEFGFSATFYGLAKDLDATGGELIAPNCRVDFGCERCAPGGVLDDGTTIDSLMQTGTVTATDGARAITATGIADIGRPLNGGLLTWLTGNNSNLSKEAKSVDPTTGDIVLVLAMFLPIQIGDTFKLLSACDKTIGTCAGSHHNGPNFQGEPFVPGPDWELNYPDFHAPHP